MSYERALQRLRDERVRMSVTQEQMSRYIHISQSYYSKVERGERLLAYYELKSMCEHGIDVHFIFTGQRCGGKYKDFFGRLSYTELLGCLRILSAAVKYLYQNDTAEQWEPIYRQVAYLNCMEDQQRAEANVFYGLRKRLDCSQKKMAGQLGVDVKKLRALENSKTFPDSEIVYKLYDMYCIPPAVVLKDAEGLANVISCLLELMKKEKGEFVFWFLTELHDNILFPAFAGV